MNIIGIIKSCLATLIHLKNRTLTVGSIVAFSVFLSACLESDKPLIEAKDGTRWFDQNELYAMELDSSFVPSKNSYALRPKVTQYLYTNQSWHSHRGRFSHSDKSYRFELTGSSEFILRSLPNTDKNTVLVQRKTKSINYGFARKLEQQVPDLPAIYAKTFDYILVSVPINPLREEVAKLRDSGVSIVSKSKSSATERQESYSIDSKDSLDAVAELLKPRYLAYGNDLKKYSSVYLIAEKPETRNRMIAVANGVECLSRAGHRYDPALKHIKDYAMGSISVDDISPGAAKPVCEAAFSKREFLGELADSVVYALARIKMKAGETDEVLDLLKLINGNHAGLSVVAAASIEATRAYQEGRSYDDALNIVDKDLSNAKKGSIAEFNMLASQAHLLSIQTQNKASQAESRKIYRYLSENGHKYGKLLLARQLIQGIGGPKDISEARDLFLQLLEDKMPEAYTDLGLAAYNGNMGFVQNYAMAADFFNDSIELANTAYAYYLKGFMHLYGQGVLQDPEQGLRDLHESHRRGYISATREVGLATYHGWGTEKDTKKAIELLTRASEQGDTNALADLKKFRETNPQNFLDEN